MAAATGEGGARARGTDASECLQGLQALQAAGPGGGADAADQAATGALIAASPPGDASAGGPRAAPNLALRPQRAPALARWRGVLRELVGRGNPAGARQLGTILVRGGLAFTLHGKQGVGKSDEHSSNYFSVVCVFGSMQVNAQ